MACAARGPGRRRCVRNHPVVTFWRRLLATCASAASRWVLVRRGCVLMRAEPDVVAHVVWCGCAAMTPDEAYARLSALVTRTAQRSE